MKNAGGPAKDGRPRVLVVGGGPAGLAAAERLLERAEGRVRVRLVTLGHHFGGKADSWRDPEGRLIDHGLHVIFSWYTAMKGLLRRAGVDVEAHLVPAGGHTIVYEPRDGRVHDLAFARNPALALHRALGYSGLTGAEKRSIARFILANLGVFLGARDLEPLDDLCFTAWCLSRGLAPSIVQTSVFRISRLAQLNWPGEISAYSMLRSIEAAGHDFRGTQYAFCDGGMSERFWQPLATHLACRGAELATLRKLVGLELAGRRVVAATFAEPDPAGHERAGQPRGRPVFDGKVPVKPRSEEQDRDFDHLICTLPATALQELSPGGGLWRVPELARARELRGIASLAMQIWHREPVTKRYPSVIGGLEGPLAFTLDAKQVMREHREDPTSGSVIYLVGQETGYERLSDEEHLALALRDLSRLPGYEKIDRRGVLHYQVIRNRAAHKLYFNAEPGVQKFRPPSRTSLENLWLAGDWVKNELDFPCMEAAVRSGQEAADGVLAALPRR